jgi:nucleotide-binding universal stress UspA family protein
LEQKLAARATVFHALHPALFGCVRLVSSPEKVRHVEKEVEQAAREWFAERVRQAGFTEDPNRIEIAYGEPRYEILSAARRLESDLIIMGTRGAGAIDRHLLGSVAIALLRGASCPVLVVPGEAGA